MNSLTELYLLSNRYLNAIFKFNCCYSIRTKNTNVNII
jgi:hypothetical protein